MLAFWLYHDIKDYYTAMPNSLIIIWKLFFFNGDKLIYTILNKNK